MNRALGDLGDPANENAIGERIDLHVRAVTDLDVGDVGLVNLDHSLHRGQVGNGQEHRPGVVHRPDDRGLALLYVEPRHASGDGRLDYRFRQSIPGLLEVGLRLQGSELRGLE